MAGHGQAQTRQCDMEGYVLDVCQGFAQDNCQGKLAQQPVYEIISSKTITFLIHKPMAYFPTLISEIEENVDDIMALMAFLPPSPLENPFIYPAGFTFDFPSNYAYDFDINPTFVIEYGTLAGQIDLTGIRPSPGSNNNFNSGFGTNGAGEFSYIDGSGNQIFYESPDQAAAIALAQQALDLAFKGVQLTWVWYTGPVGSQLLFPYYDYAFGTGGTVLLTSVAPPADVQTPTFGSVFKIPINTFAGPLIFLAQAPNPPFDLNYHYGLKFGAGTAPSGFSIASGDPGESDTANPLWVHGDYGGSGGSGSAGAGSAGGSGGSGP